MSLVETVKGLTNTYHAYVFGTAFWYILRGFMRIVDPEMVAGWFRPPRDAHFLSNDMELYNIRTDAWGLISLGMVLIALSDAVPLPSSMVGSALATPAPAQYKKPYARAAILITMFHHVTTGLGAYQHWRMPTHHTTAMDIGVYANVVLTVMGVLALVFGLKDDGAVAAVGGKSKKKA